MSDNLVRRPPLRLGMLGAWHVHAAGYAADLADHQDAELVAVWDQILSRASHFAADHHIRMCSDLQELLAADLDGVLVCAPTTQHEEVITAALHAGLPVFSEKALGPDAASSRRIAGTAAARGLALGVALPWAMSGLCRSVAGLIAGGELGDVVSSRIRLANDALIAGWLPDDFFAPELSGGGVLIDLAAHPLSMAQVLFGSSPRIVGCTVAARAGTAVQDTVSAVLDHGTGGITTIEASLACGSGGLSLEVHGTCGSVEYGPATDGSLVLRSPGQQERQVAIAENPSPLLAWLTAIRQQGGTDVQSLLACQLSELTDRLVSATDSLIASGSGP